MHGDDESDREKLRACRETSLGNQRRFIRGRTAPLADVVREHALVHLPPAAAARLRLVHPTWARWLSSPLFAVAHAAAPHRVSGVFVPDVGFLPFDGSDTVPSPLLSFAPASSEVTVLSSTHGVACCFSPADDVYFVCNPATASWATSPCPPFRTWPRPAIVVLFLGAKAYNFRGDYTLVYASECAPGSGTYCFHVFSSATSDAWRITNDAAIAPAEGLVAASGVAAGATAWWRTSIGTAVGYSPETGRVELVLCPGDSGMWEIGSAGEKLHCAVRTGSDVVVFRLVEHGSSWEEAARVSVEHGSSWEEAARVSVEEMLPPLLWQSKHARDDEAHAIADDDEDDEVVEDDVSRVQLLGFQGTELEVVAVAGRRLVAFDMGTRRGREIKVPYQGEEQWDGAEYAAHTNTLALVPPPAVRVLQAPENPETDVASL